MEVNECIYDHKWQMVYSEFAIHPILDIGRWTLGRYLAACCLPQLRAVRSGLLASLSLVWVPIFI